MKKEKLLEWKKVRLLMERKDEHGRPVPFDIEFFKRDGDYVVAKNVICTSALSDKKMHRIQFQDNWKFRMVLDVLITRINDTLIKVY